MSNELTIFKQWEHLLTKDMQLLVKKWVKRLKII